MRLHGLEKGVNDHAFARDIVMHGAWYVNEDFARIHHYVGRSWGCFALDSSAIRPVINTIKNGSLIFAYYPDKDWLNGSPFLHCSA